MGGVIQFQPEGLNQESQWCGPQLEFSLSVTTAPYKYSPRFQHPENATRVSCSLPAHPTETEYRLNGTTHTFLLQTPIAKYSIEIPWIYF